MTLKYPFSNLSSLGTLAECYKNKKTWKIQLPVIYHNHSVSQTILISLPEMKAVKIHPLKYLTLHYSDELLINIKFTMETLMPNYSFIRCEHSNTQTIWIIVTVNNEI